jgi:hypothetical protein
MSTSSSGYNSKDENANKKVIKKLQILLTSDNPLPIIAKLKSIFYIKKILTSMKDVEHNNKIKVADGLEKRRLEIIKQLREQVKAEEIAKNLEELKELKTKLERFKTKLDKLHVNKLYKPKWMKNNSENTRAELEKANTILNNPLDVRYLEVAIYNIKKHINIQERIIRELKEKVCSRILTPKQVGPICWFMATFVAMFYSQRNRKVLLKASKRWKQDELFTLLKHVLDDKYLMSENEQEDYEKFSDETFGNILKLLFEKDSKSFPFPYNPKIKVGFGSEIYICKLYNLLGVDCEMFDYNGGELLTYSYLNKEYHVMDYIFDGDETKYRVKKEYEGSKKGYVLDLKDTYYTKNKSTPTILILRVCVDYIILGNRISDDGMYDELTSMRDEIKYNDKTYILDSVIISDDKSCHSITGITCKGIKYIYNGWTRTSMDPVMANQEITRNIPCELQRHDWKVKDGDNFCLNTRTCIPDILKERLANEKRLCFNFSKGNRLLIYVLKDEHLEKLNKAAMTLHATIRRSVAQKEHLEKLRKADVIKATIRRRSVA